MLRTLFLALVVVAGGCSKSHDVGLDAGGTGGTGGAGSGAEGGSGGVIPECVVSECEAAPTLPIPIPINACCTDQKLCGLSTALLGGGECLERDAPGVIDSSCPSQSMMGFTAPGCCTEGGTCGVMDTFIGFGCATFPGSAPQACGGGAGSGGAGGSGGGGSGGSGGSGGGTPMCSNCPRLGMFASFAGVTPCCGAGNVCGGSLQGMCIPLNQPGEPSSECPAVSVMGFPLEGCCRPDGTCGADDGGAIGFGCAEAPGVTGTCTPTIPD